MFLFKPGTTYVKTKISLVILLVSRQNVFKRSKMLANEPPCNLFMFHFQDRSAVQQRCSGNKIAPKQVFYVLTKGLYPLSFLCRHKTYPVNGAEKNSPLKILVLRCVQRRWHVSVSKLGFNLRGQRVDGWENVSS